MAEREVRYCTTEDGVRIAYCPEGEGPALIVCSMSLESFSMHHVMPELEEFYRQVGAGRMLVHYDGRGTGLSERHTEDFSLHATVLDLQAVADAAGLDRFAIWAPVLSGPRAIQYTADNPGRVSALVLCGTFARVLDAFTPEALQAFEALALSDWELYCRTVSDMGAARVEAGDAPLRAAKGLSQSADGQAMARFIRQHVDVDVTPCLGAISARTLLVHRIADSVFPVALGQVLAAGIPRARLVTPPGAASAFIYGDVKAIIDAINAFLDEDPETCRLPGGLDALPSRGRKAGASRTIIYTDIVGNTDMLQRLGDDAWRAVLREHERITRELLRAHGGTEVKTMGDGFMASFDSSTNAVECAIGLQRAFDARNRGGGVDRGVGASHSDDALDRTLNSKAAGALDSNVAPGDSPLRAAAPGATPVEPLHVRVGLNAGEPIAEDDPDGRGDLFGTAVIRAARIAALAQGGEILAANVVRELAEGKGFMFGDRGEVALRGFDDPVRVYEVRWRE